jgi:hypothetical protein
MDYVYAMAGALQRKEKVGDGDCVVLVQHYAKAPHTSQWKQGRAVLDGLLASWHFLLASWRSRTGFYVIDQWKPKQGRGAKPYISSRFISAKRKKQNADGTWPNASDNAQAFSVIE